MQHILELIEKEEFGKVFSELNKLGISDSQYTKLKEDFINGKANNFLKDRLKVFLESYQDKINESEKWYEKGEECYKSESYQQAIEYFTRAIQMNPEFYKAYYGRARAKRQLNDYHNAIMDMDNAIILNNRDSDLFSERATNYALSKIYEPAIEDYIMAVDLIDDQYNNIYLHNLYYDIGVCKREQQKYEEAITYFTKSIHIESNFADSYFIRGEAYFYLEEYQKAIQDFEEAQDSEKVKLNKEYDFENEGFWNMKGDTYFKLGSYKEAIESFNHAILLNPHNVIAYNARGNSYAGLGNYQQAIKDYDMALNIAPNYANAYANKGIALIKLKQYKEGIKLIDKALSIDNTLLYVDEYKAEAQKQLKKWSFF